ncbi:MAG: prephenate dehydrogenase/arogenate dehydrogenase family protein [Anaerolineae bacterium]|jgi:prephenate dehydrogenase|nr:prephenate dehydrogenase/arogenate dehydrogenase family protein [Anaerolineae bacterium]
MPEVAVAILGLSRIGTSVGLALKAHNQRPNTKNQFKITGYSGRSEHVKTAQKLSAIDQTASQIHEAVRGRDIVVMALPYAEVEAAYQMIARDLRPGVVVLDFSPLKVGPLKWAAKHLGKDAHVVGATPLLNPVHLFEPLDAPDKASADLFQNGTVLLMPGVTCIPEAIELGQDFASIVGARTQFIDPAEHDATLAATELLPNLLGLAYYLSVSGATGWGDVQRATNPSFGALTHAMFDTHPDDFVSALRDDRQALVTAIDGVLNALRQLRTALASDDRDALEAATTAAAETYEAWYNKRFHWKFDASDAKPPEAPSIMGMFLGNTLANRLRGKRGEDDGK